jgi:hypothetical protein
MGENQQTTMVDNQQSTLFWHNLTIRNSKYKKVDYPCLFFLHLMMAQIPPSPGDGLPRDAEPSLVPADLVLSTLFDR